jgi:hypothetical protein
MQSGLTEQVLRKWRKQGVFYRYIDGDRRNMAAKNLKPVTLKDALVHINDWICDWDLELTDSEILLVNNSLWRCEILKRL